MRIKSYEVWSGLKKEYTGKNRKEVDPTNAIKAYEFHLHTFEENLVAYVFSTATEFAMAKLGHPCCGGWPFLPDRVTDKLNQLISRHVKYRKNRSLILLTPKQVRKISPDSIEHGEQLWWRKHDDI